MTLMDFMIQLLEVADGQPLNLPIDQTNMYFKLSKENFVQSENETKPSTGYNHNIYVDTAYSQLSIEACPNAWLPKTLMSNQL